MNKQSMKNTGDYQNIMKTNFIKFALFIVLTFLLTACGGQKSLIFVIDFSESVSPEARADAFKAIQAEAKLLGRGDSITVIPVTSDALIESGGKVLRLEAGETRKLRDKDLKEFQEEIEKGLAAMSSNATYKQTDLFGALHIAQEETANQTARKRRVVVIVLSDLVHSTSQIRFEVDAAFVKAETSRRYAEKSVKAGEWNGAEIYLGWLESSDLRKMNAPRREAVRQFWQEYFKIGNAKKIRFATDGAGQVENFIKAQ